MKYVDRPSRVFLDGRDISHMVKRVSVHWGPGEIAVANMHVSVTDVTRDEDDFIVIHIGGVAVDGSA